MSETRLALTHLVQKAETSAEAPPLLILLHGIGSNEQDLFGLVPYLDPRFTFVSVRAPNPYGWGGFAWFEIEWQANRIDINQQQAMHSLELLVQFIGEAVDAYGADPKRVYLAGFSQGAMMSAWVTLTHPELVAGAVLMSGRMPAELRAQIVEPERLTNKPILVVHGTRDQTLPISNGREIRDVLQTLPVDLTYHEYPMAHEVSAQSLTDVANWLHKQLG
jgi:phospholipase/carboxylesterase